MRSNLIHRNPTAILLSAILLTFAVAAQARDVVVVLKDGRQIRGTLVSETSSSVTIAVAGIETTFPRPMVEEMKVQLSLEEQYKQKRGEIADDNFSARYDLARWLYDQKSPAGYKLALKELDSILSDKPDHQQAMLLRNVVNERLKLEPDKDMQDKPAPSKPDAPTPDAPEAGGDQAAPEAGESELLTPEQINMIRIYEVRIDNEPRASRLQPDVIKDLYEKFRDDPVMEPYLGRRGEQRFKALKGHEQLSVLFKLRAREFYDKIDIRDEPETMIKFRTRIHPTYIVRYCGRCHGQGEAPGLYLHTRNITANRTTYTNYMILRRTTVGQNRTPIIDKLDPQSSPLIQFGLPRRDATNPHPEAPGLRQYFSGPNDPRIADMIEWIQSLYSEDYPVDFTPPKAKAAKPAEPAAEPAENSDTESAEN